MTKTVFEDADKLESVLVENAPRIKQIVRTLSGSTDDTHDAIQMVDNEISSWINAGWKLFDARYIGTDPQGIVVMYVLTRDL